MTSLAPLCQRPERDPREAPSPPVAPLSRGPGVRVHRLPERTSPRILNPRKRRAPRRLPCQSLGRVSMCRAHLLLHARPPAWAFHLRGTSPATLRSSPCRRCRFQRSNRTLHQTGRVSIRDSLFREPIPTSARTSRHFARPCSSKSSRSRRSLAHLRAGWLLTPSPGGGRWVKRSTMHGAECLRQQTWWGLPAIPLRLAATE